MTKVRVTIAVILFFLGLFLSVFQVLDQHYVSAALFFVLAVIVAFIILLGFWTACEMPLFKEVSGFIVLILGLSSVFFESSGFDLDRQKAHIDAMSSFVKLELRQCPINKELYLLQKEGVKACALQNNADQMQAVFDLQKTTVFGPVTSLLDGLRAEVTASNKDWCAEVFKVTYKLCPEAFLTMPKNSRIILEKD